MSLRQQLQGTGVALVTPFTSNQQVDFDSLGKVIDAMINGGTEYLITLGTTGETPTLDKQEKLDIVNYTFKQLRKELTPLINL